MTCTNRFSWLAALVAAGLIGAVAVAQPLGSTFTFQGELQNAGTPVAFAIDLQFKLYTDIAAGIQIGPTLSALAVTPANGRFTTDLDFGAGSFGSTARFLEISVRSPAGSGSYLTLSPRQRISAAPASQFSLEAATANTAQNTAQLNGQPAAFYLNASNLTSGTIPSGLLNGSYNGALTFNNPNNAFTGNGFGLTGVNADMLDGQHASAFLQSIPLPLSLSGSDANSIIRAQNSSTAANSAGILGLSASPSGSTFGVFGRSDSIDGRGVYGFASAASGVSYGGWFESASPNGRGIMAKTTATSGINYAAYFETASTNGIGVLGYAPAATGLTIGVSGQTYSTTGKGVSGMGLATTGVGYGGYFSSASTDGYGVYGLASAVTTNVTYGVMGQSNSESGRGVYGRAYRANGVNYGVYGTTTSPSGYGVYGAGGAYGVYGSGGYDVSGASTDTSGRGVYGLASSISGTTYGGFFQSDSTAGRGVYGFASATSGTNYGLYGQSSSVSGTGVYGLASSGTGSTYGGRFESSSTLGSGVAGRATASTGTTNGVYGYNASSSGRGVWGIADAATGSTMGVRGEAVSTGGTGVFGYASATTGYAYGMFGQSTSTNGCGVYGNATSSTGTVYGVYGGAHTNGYAVYAGGNMGGAGTKAFRIDHPADPENKYLIHYSSESPEVINFYRGTVVLNGSGEANVELPPYFARINKSPSYQLTAIGAPMPMLHVASEIDEGALGIGAKAEPSAVAPVCRFRIAGGLPGGKVSWRVEAIRNDRWVQQNSAPVEVDKQGAEKGTYQHPELYGQPAERGMDWPAQRRAAESASPRGEHQ